MLGVLSREPLDSAHLEYVNAARSASSRLMALLNDILDFAKMEEGHIALEEEQFSLRELAQDVARMFQRALEEKTPGAQPSA